MTKRTLRRSTRLRTAKKSTYHQPGRPSLPRRRPQSKKKVGSPLTRLPDELLVQICEFFPDKELFCLRFVCKKVRDIATEILFNNKPFRHTIHITQHTLRGLDLYRAIMFYINHVNVSVQEPVDEGNLISVKEVVSAVSRAKQLSILLGSFAPDKDLLDALRGLRDQPVVMLQIPSLAICQYAAIFKHLASLELYYTVVDTDFAIYWTTLCQLPSLEVLSIRGLGKPTIDLKSVKFESSSLRRLILREASQYWDVVSDAILSASSKLQWIEFTGTFGLYVNDLSRIWSRGMQQVELSYLYIDVNWVECHQTTDVVYGDYSLADLFPPDSGPYCHPAIKEILLPFPSSPQNCLDITAITRWFPKVEMSWFRPSTQLTEMIGQRTELKWNLAGIRVYLDLIFGACSVCLQGVCRFALMDGDRKSVV